MKKIRLKWESFESRFQKLHSRDILDGYGQLHNDMQEYDQAVNEVYFSE